MSQFVQPLWDDPHGPSLTLFPVPDAARGVILLVPGGGYGGHAVNETEITADRLNREGFNVAMLRYRVEPHRHPLPIFDAQRAMRLLRTRGVDWGLDVSRIIALGFSAGGHLVSTLAVHADRFECAEDDLCGKVSSRPDAVVLAYPVIDMAGEFAHPDSRDRLCGKDCDRATLELLSTHRHVSSRTPPVFLFHAATDELVPMQNSLLFASACRAAGVKVELHISERGCHGQDEPPFAHWWNLAVAFIHRRLA